MARTVPRRAGRTREHERSLRKRFLPHDVVIQFPDFETAVEFAGTVTPIAWA
jgi:hypothetical protein